MNFCKDQTLSQTKKNSIIFIFVSKRGNLICLPIESVVNFEHFFFSRVFKIRSKNTGVDNEGKNEADERDSRIHGFRVTVIYLLIFRRNSNVHNLKNVG